MQKRFYNEIPIITASGSHKAFLESGFYEPTLSTIHVHEHNYAEIHLFAEGGASFVAEGTRTEVQSGDMLVIPRKTYHYCAQKDEGTLHSTFQLDCNVQKVVKYTLGKELVGRFFEAREQAKKDGDHSAVAAHIALLCSYFEREKKLFVHPVTDYALLICEFFSKNYDLSVKLSDLAEVLHLSERQTERLVIEHTGRNFRDELAATRVRIARYLLETTELPMTEIARRVGYSSYSGFWKAMKKF